MRTPLFLYMSIVFAILGGVFMYAVHPSGAEVSKLGKFVHGENSQFINFTTGFGVTIWENITQPGTIIQRIVAIVFSFLGLIAVIMIIYAGFLWLTSGGEEERAEKGRTLLFQAVIGLIIILASWSVAYFVLRMLTLAIVK